MNLKLAAASVEELVVGAGPIPWTILAVLAALYGLLEFFFGVSQAPQEPLLAKSSIPYIGHTVSLLRHKMKYYEQLSARIRHPIYTLSMMGGKVYVVNQPELVQAVYRNNKALSFANLAAEVVSRLSMASKETRRILLHNVTGEHGDVGYTMEGYKAMHAALAPGPGLNQINELIIPDLAAAVTKLNPGPGKIRIGLYQWVRHTITMATSNAVYGSHNPFREPEIYRAFWDFENNLTVLLLGIFPALFSPSAYRGRACVRRAFERYFAAGQHARGSELVQSRHAVAVRNGVALPDIAGLETTMSIGVLANTAPAAFWTVWHVFAHPPLLADLRAELEPLVRTTIDNAAGSRHHHLDLNRLRTQCPLLLSTWHEVLRHIGCGTSARLVRDDHMLQDRYLLRKNGVVHMPSQVVHGTAALWEAAPPSSTSPAAAAAAQPVEAFDPRRFLSAKPAPGAYRPFGGGSTLCPGRHLSAAEIQALVAMMVLRYEMEPVAARPGWTKPETYLTSFASAILSPRWDPLVDVSPRKGWEAGVWTFDAPKSSSR